jgi:hypothetical protein
MKYFLFIISAILLILILILFYGVEIASFGDDMECVVINIKDIYFVMSIYTFLLFLLPILSLFIITAYKIYKTRVQ